MRRYWTVWASSAACFLLFFPCFVSGQQAMQPHWQGGAPPSSLLQSRARLDSSQQPTVLSEQPFTLDHPQHPAASDEQPSRQRSQPLQPGAQEAEPSTQRELPVVWPPTQPAASAPGYLGLSTRDFYRARFCMHAMTIQGVEVVAVVPDSPAARAGLRSARELSPGEAVAATVAGLLVLSPVAPLAASFLRASGGVDHGDIILAVGGKRVKTQDEFERVLTSFGPHTVVYLTVRRDEAVLQLPVRLDDWPAPASPSPLQQASVPDRD